MTPTDALNEMFSFGQKQLDKLKPDNDERAVKLFTEIGHNPEFTIEKTCDRLKHLIPK